jgi:MSHA biogenesis protein MshN
MSLINKMLQDLDQRHATDGGGKKTLTEQLRPVQTRRDWRRVMWEVGIGLLIGAGWALWVMYQISPRSVVTDLAFQLQAKRSQAVAQAPVQTATAPPPSAQALAPTAAEPPPAATAPASPPSGYGGTEAADMGLFKLATEIATPFKEKSYASKSGSARRRATEPASAPGTATKEGRPKLATAGRATVSKAPAQASIDKRLHLATPAELAENEYRKASGLLNQGRVAEAIDGYKRSLMRDAGHVPARRALVGLLLENKRIDEAQLYLQEGLSLNPDRSDYAMLLARIQVERGDLQGAHELLSGHAASATGDAEYLAFDAALLQRLGRHKEAVTGYQAALKLAPRAGLWWMGIGISLQAENRSAEALDAFRRARAVGGLSPDLLAFVDQRVKQLQ